MRILIFGDSITQGFWDLEYGGWAQRVRKEYDRETVKNLAGRLLAFFDLGIAGEMTGGVVERMGYEIEARRWQDDPIVLVFQVGINDTQFAGDEMMATPEKYREELDVLLSSARHYAERILFIGLTPVDDARCNPWAHSPTGVSFSNKRILEFEGELRKFCLEKDVACVQIFEKFQAAQQKDDLLLDGLHPNDAGHQLIADLVKPELDKLL